MPDDLGGEDGYTLVMEHCEECPPMRAWPMKHLIYGTCPRCGKHAPAAWRMAIARRIIEKIEARRG